MEREGRRKKEGKKVVLIYYRKTVLSHKLQYTHTNVS
jgi:hypothetical protein